MSVDGTIGSTASWTIAPTAPRPEAIAPANGLVDYWLYNVDSWNRSPTSVSRAHFLLVQMLKHTTVKAELFPGLTANTTQFDANTVTYT